MNQSRHPKGVPSGHGGRYAEEIRPDATAELDATTGVAHQLVAGVAPFPQRDEAVALINRASRLDWGEIVDLGTAWEQSVLSSATAANRSLDDAWVKDNPVTQASKRCTDAVDTACRAQDAGKVVAAAGMVTAERMKLDDALRRNAAMGARNAMEALYARDLVDRPGSGFTSDDYRLLTGPWRTSIGPVHPDDPT